MLTQSQERVYRRICLMGRTFFAGQRGKLQVKPRLFPLIVGPTGAGKSHLVKQAAEALQAHPLRVTYGDWIVQGARESAGSPTVDRILKAVQKNDRVLLHIDELDKCQLSFEQDWARSVANDLWNVLDGELPYERLSGAAGAAELRKRVAAGLWIVGSGTWQQVFETTEQPALGFAAGTGAAKRDPEELKSKVIKARLIPTELLARFATEIQFLLYPETAEEKRRLLEETGILDLARAIAVEVSERDLDFNASGMRCLESLAARLLLAAQEKTEISLPAAPASKPEPAPSPQGAPSELRLIQVRRDPFAHAYAVWAPDEAPDRPTMELRFRLVRGRSRMGWAQIVEPDPALLGFEGWCRTHDLPLPASPRLQPGVRAQLQPEATQVQLATTPRALHRILFANRSISQERALWKRRYEELFPAATLPSRVASEFEEYPRYILKRGLTHGGSAKLPADLCIVELHRRFVADVHRGAILAHDWWTRHRALDPKAMEALAGQVKRLWLAAVESLEQAADWNSVTDCYFEPELLHGEGRSIAATPWLDLTPEQRSRVQAFFETQNSAD